MLEILVPCVITCPKCTGGAPLVLLVLLLGTGDGGGVSLVCETCVVSEISKRFRRLLAGVWFGI